MTKTTWMICVALGLALAGCRVIDIRTDPLRTGLHSDALLEGYATLGFADDPSFLRIDVLDGRSPGAVFHLELWYLARVELGLVGLAFGVGPFDVGLGTLFYHPRSPAAPRLHHRHWDVHGPRDAGDHEHHDDHHAHDAHDDHHDDDHADAPHHDEHDDHDPG